MRILVISPHLDDEVLGCGGTIARHVKEGDELFVCFIANRVYGHKFDIKKYEIEKQCAIRAKRILDYNEAIFLSLNDERLDVSIQDIIILLEKYVNKVKPDIVYIPFMGDNNQDHRAVFDAARVVLRPVAVPFINSVYMYEIPSSTEQSPPLPQSAFLPNCYIDIEKYIDIKISAFKCYITEKRSYPHPRSGKALRILAKKRGIEVGSEYAEAFSLVRMIKK